MDLERMARMETQVESIKEDVKELKSDIKEIHSRVTTSNREIVEKIDDMQMHIDQKMNMNVQIATAQHEQIRKEVIDDMQKMETRISSLENWKWYVIGAAAAIGYLIAHLADLQNLIK